MKYYPVNLNIAGKKVLVVGGGSVASRKVERLHERGADITVIAPEVSEEIKKLADKNALKIIERIYEAGDEKGAFAVFCAVSAGEENSKMEKKLYEKCVKKNILINVADKPDFCHFYASGACFEGRIRYSDFYERTQSEACQKNQGRFRKSLRGRIRHLR
jgi:Siroheme synthase (precorrin-2 oxidase/ferrochelatase domain)